jgi:hypothetical protein
MLYLGLATLGGCEAPPDAEVTAVRGALVARTSNNFNKNTPKVAEPRQDEATVDMALRVGTGTNANDIATYQTALTSDGARRPWYRDSDNGSGRTTERPSRVWEAPFTGMEFLGTDPVDNTVQDESLGPVFPRATQLNLHPVGPPSTLTSFTTEFVDGAHAQMTTFALMDDGEMFHAYLPAAAWSDFALTIGGGAATPCGSGKTPYTGPQAIRRKPGMDGSQTQDSVFYGCGATSPAQVCEYRVGGPAHAKTFYACFGAGSTFAANTRPVAFADAGTSTSPTFNTGERWVFSVVDSGGQRKLVGLRENNSIDATQPAYDALKSIDAQANTATFSSPAPVMYTDPVSGATTLAVFYMRTLSGGTTKLMVAKAVSPFSTFAVTTAFDPGVALPAGIDPEPYLLWNQPGIMNQVRVMFRMPVAGSQTDVRDTVDLIQEPDGNWVKTQLPSALDATNLYVTQDSSSTLFRVDRSTGARTAVATNWGGITSFTTDRDALGYAIKAGELWEINLNDGTGRKLQGSWNGVTNLIFGYDKSFGATKDAYPRLWAIRSNKLIRIDPANAGVTELTTFANGVKLMAASYSPQTLNLVPTIYVVDGAGTLYSVPPATAQPTSISATGAWADAHAMTADPVNNYVYIASGPAVASGMRVYRLDQNGTVLGRSSTFSNAQWMTTVNGVAYLMKSRQLMRVGGSGSTVSLTAAGGQIWDYSETGMVGREL